MQATIRRYERCRPLRMNELAGKVNETLVPSSQTNSDLLEFTVTDPDPKLASRLAVPVEQEAV